MGRRHKAPPKPQPQPTGPGKKAQRAELRRQAAQQRDRLPPLVQGRQMEVPAEHLSAAERHWLVSRSQVQEPQVIFLDPEPNDPPQPADAEPEVLVLPEPRRMTMGRRRVMDLGLIALLLSGPRR